MPTASETAKAKYQAVLDNPLRRESISHYKNREASTRAPSTGSLETNMVSRRPSSGSQTMVHKHPLRNMIRDWMNRPAY